MEKYSSKNQNCTPVVSVCKILIKFGINLKLNLNRHTLGDVVVTVSVDKNKITYFKKVREFLECIEALDKESNSEGMCLLIFKKINFDTQFSK